MTNKLKSILKKPAHQAAIFSILFFGFYLSLIPKGLVGYGWSADFIRIGYLGGNYWAIGLGLLLKIVGIFTNLLPFSVMKNSYILASFMGSLSLGILYYLLSIMEDFLKLSSKRVGYLVKVLAIVLLGTSKPFLLSSIFVERYMLVVLGIETVALLLIKMHKNKYRFGSEYLLLALTLILGISFHWLFLWTTLALLIFFIGRQRTTKSTLLSLVSGFLLIVLGGFITGHLFSSNSAIPHTYTGSANIKDSVSNYSKTYLTDGFVNDLSINIKQVSIIFSEMASHLKSSSGVLVLFLGLIGIRILFDKYGRKSLMGLLFIAGALMLPSLFFSGVKVFAEAIELYMIIVVTLMSVLAWIGATFITNRLSKGLSIIHGSRVGHTSLIVFTGALMIFSLMTSVSHSRYSGFEDNVVREILNELPEESLLICFDDLMCSDLIYLSTIEKVGGELKIVPHYFHPNKYILDLSEHRPYGYKDYPYLIHEVVSTALANNTRVFAVGVRSDYYRFLGFDLGFIHYLPMGNYGEVLLTTPDAWPTINKLNHNNQYVSKDTLLENRFTSLLINNRVLNSHTYFLTGKYRSGYDEMNTTSVVANQLSENDFSNFLSSRNSAEQQKRNALFVESDKIDSVKRVYEEIPLFIEGGYYGRVADLVRGTIMLNPLDSSTRKKAADIYESINLGELAEFEMSIYKKLQNN